MCAKAARCINREWNLENLLESTCSGCLWTLTAIHQKW